ncbi:MAG: hypothetical protein LUD00_03590 [Prevotellaceae bacterium]|nr:hypothetical protein [Prevotellaceae bacterium]
MAGRNIVHKLTAWAARAIHRKGFGVQSPWAYELVRDVFFEQLPYYAFKELKEQTRSMNTKNKNIRHNEQLFRIAHYLHPSSIVEINDGCPAGLLYLAAPHSDIPYTLITHSEPPTQFKNAFRGKVITGNHLTTLQSLFTQDSPVGILHICDTNEAESIYDWAVKNTDDNSVIILENLARNAVLWKKIISDERAIITFDFSKWGMIVFDKKRVKQNYLL